MADPSAQTAAAGQTVAGRYEIVRAIGAGGMGEVYEARHRVTRRRVALKLLPRPMPHQREAQERFLREAQAAAAIGHPGIVDVLDAGEDADGSLFVVMELLEGETLADTLARAGRLAPGFVADVLTGVLDALGAAHAQGIVHRDIKPANIFLLAGDGAPRTKLLDFGVAKGAEGTKVVTRSGTAIGTPPYMSPEQIRGESRIDGRSDLWSVGVVLFETLTGQLPFDGPNGPMIWLGVLSKTHPRLAELRPDLPEALGAVVDRALAKECAQRFESAAVMKDALRDAVRDASAAATVPPAPRAVVAGARGAAGDSGVRSRDVLPGAPGEPQGASTDGPAAPIAPAASRTSAVVVPYVTGVLDEAEAEAGAGADASHDEDPTLVAMPAPPPAARPLAGQPSVIAAPAHAARAHAPDTRTDTARAALEQDALFRERAVVGRRPRRLIALAVLATVLAVGLVVGLVAVTRQHPATTPTAALAAPAAPAAPTTPSGTSVLPDRPSVPPAPLAEPPAQGLPAASGAASTAAMSAPASRTPSVPRMTPAHAAPSVVPRAPARTAAPPRAPRRATPAARPPASAPSRSPRSPGAHGVGII